MKSNLAKVSLALLSAVFILGCEDQGSGAVGLDLVPQFDKAGTPGDPCPGGGVRDHKGHCHGGDDPPLARPFTGTLTGNISSVGDLELIEGLADNRATLDLSFFRTAPSDGGYTDDEGLNCFGNDEYTDILIHVHETRNVGQISFVFDATGNDGTTPINYGAILYPLLVDGDLPPAEVGDITTITGGTFELIHNGGPGRKIACIAEGILNVLNYSMLIVRN